MKTTINITVIIPALNPDGRLVDLVARLGGYGLPVIVVNDGSKYECEGVFAALRGLGGCRVLNHERNRGKGAALKTGMAYLRENAPDCPGCVTADADMQHRPEDIYAVARALVRHPDSLVLGSRDFSGGSVPFRSRWGNRITAAVFRLSTGLRCEDTQTGLRGIPARFVEECLEIRGQRFEYEMNMLIQAAQRKIPILSVPIATVYEGDGHSSHFDTLRDSARIYGQLLKYGCASLASSAVDLLAFAIACNWLFTGLPYGVFLATVIGRLTSGSLNFALNKNWVFRARGRTTLQAAQYAALFVSVMCISGLLVTWLASGGMPRVAAKVLVDGVLFFVNYRVQQQIVFKGVDASAEAGGWN